MYSDDIFAYYTMCFAVLSFYHPDLTSICLEHSSIASDGSDHQECEAELADSVEDESAILIRQFDTAIFIANPISAKSDHI